MEAGSVSRMGGQQEEGDRISSLSDDTLCHILSFIPTKYSVRTRVLSTRWKGLFSHVPVLDFRSNHLKDNDKRRRFIDFVNWVLLNYNFPEIPIFRLHSHGKQPEDVANWIMYAIHHNVQILNLEIHDSSDEPKIMIPPELFSSEKLSVLKLSGDFCLEPCPISALLPSLKTLDISYFSFDLSAQSIMSICPVLENLMLYNCSFGEEDLLDITNTSLKKISLDDCDCHELILNVPSLVRFEFENSDLSGHCGGNVLTSLVEAVIKPDTNMGSPAAFVQLLHLVSHARHLTLCMKSFGAFHGYVEALPTFHKLTRLEVGLVSQTVYKLLPDFLRKCDNLEVLVFSKGTFNGENDGDYTEDDIDMIYDIDMICDIETRCYNNVAICVLRHLKEIEFRLFGMGDIDWKLVAYFLKYAQVLQKMKIQSNLSWKEHYDLSKKLSTFARFSRDCQIVIENDDEIKNSDDESEFWKNCLIAQTNFFA